MNIAVLIKQVPQAEGFELLPGGRLRREGVALEMNPYCRRALGQGVALVREFGGRCVAITLGPPSAVDVAREAVACGADRAVLVSDPVLAGSDTLVTARALAAVVAHEGHVDLVLAGRNSVDADTGQVPPQLAELLGLPFLAAVKTLRLERTTLIADCEEDDGWSTAEVELPAVISCAERLCAPAKASAEQRGSVRADLVTHLDAAGLGPGPWGAAGSPTRVGAVRERPIDRLQHVRTGSLDEQVRHAAGLLTTRARDPLPEHRVPAVVRDGWERGATLVAVLADPGLPTVLRELLGAAAALASELRGSVCALVASPAPEPMTLRSWGADHLVHLTGSQAEEDLARAIAQWCAYHRPWALLAPSTTSGREVSARIAARTGAGLIGDAVALELDRHARRLLAWKPALGGALLAGITVTSPLQMVTVRPGVLALLGARDGLEPTASHLEVPAASRVRRMASGRDDLVDALTRARVVVGVGLGVDPDDYHLLRPLVQLLDAELAATRKVTDRHWLPRSRQVGITGRSITAELYIAVGISGKSNHMIGVRSAGTILAINADPQAPIFHGSDIGIVGDWREAVPLLVEELTAHRAATDPHIPPDLVLDP